MGGEGAISWGIAQDGRKKSPKIISVLGGGKGGKKGRGRGVNPCKKPGEGGLVGGGNKSGTFWGGMVKNEWQKKREESYQQKFRGDKRSLRNQLKEKGNGGGNIFRGSLGGHKDSVESPSCEQVLKRSRGMKREKRGKHKNREDKGKGHPRGHRQEGEKGGGGLTDEKNLAKRS